jgi:hypothetical protein
MCTQVEIAAYAEELRRGEEDTGDEFSRHWRQLRDRQYEHPRENWTRVAEWYQEYEEETGTMLGRD